MPGGHGQALSGVAHDMKTPLIAIGGFSGLILKHKTVEAHGGSVNMLESPERGLTFRVILPCGEKCPAYRWPA